MKYGLSGVNKVVGFSQSSDSRSVETMYEKVGKDYKNLGRLFPEGKLDKRLESYIVSFVDERSLKSMILVSKSWFLRAYLLKHRVIDLNCGKSFLEIEKHMNLVDGLSMPCEVKMSNDNALDRLIVFLTENESRYKQIRRLKAKDFDIEHNCGIEKHEKFEKLFSVISNLIEMELGQFHLKRGVINLCHNNLVSLCIDNLVIPNPIELEMKALKSLKIGILSSSTGEAEGVKFTMPLLERFKSEHIGGIEGTWDFSNVRICDIKVFFNGNVTLIGPKMEDFQLGVIDDSELILKDFPEELADKVYVRSKYTKRLKFVDSK